MVFNKLILLLVIVASSAVLSEVYSGYDKLDAMLDEITNRTFLKMLRNVYINYEEHRVNAVEKFIVNCLKKENDTMWIDQIMYGMTKLEEADLKNEFYIKLLKEMRKQKAIGSLYYEDKVEDIIYRLKKIYANRIQGPPSRIIEESVNGTALVHTTSYKLEFLERFRANMTEFAKFEKYVGAVWRDLGAFSINYDSKNTMNATLVLFAYLEYYTVKNNGTDSMLLDALMSRFEYLTEADLKNEFYIEILKNLRTVKLIGTYSICEINKIIYRLEEMYTDKIKAISVWTQVKRSVYKIFKKYADKLELIICELSD